MTQEMVRRVHKEEVRQMVRIVEEQSQETMTIMGYIIVKQYWSGIANKQRRSLSKA